MQGVGLLCVLSALVDMEQGSAPGLVRSTIQRLLSNWRDEMKTKYTCQNPKCSQKGVVKETKNPRELKCFVCGEVLKEYARK